MTDDVMRSVLLTGAAGRVGRALYEFAQAQYRWRLADRRSDALPTGAVDTMTLDITDLEACQQACAGVDTVVHLAADPSPRADFLDSLLDNNVRGTYNIFRAAKDQGCRRVVFASSIHAIEGYPLDSQATPDSPVKPINMYGVTKIFGEATGHYFAMAEGLSSIAVRIGSFEGNRADFNTNGRNLSSFVSVRDLCQLLMRCVETPDIDFAIVHGSSDNRYKRMDITSTRRLLGYRPQDDAFEKFGIGIDDRDRWIEEWDRGAQRAQSTDSS